MNVKLINDGRVTLVQNLESVNIKQQSVELIFPDYPDKDTPVIVVDLDNLKHPLIISIEDEEIKTQAD